MSGFLGNGEHLIRPPLLDFYSHPDSLFITMASSTRTTRKHGSSSGKAKSAILVPESQLPKHRKPYRSKGLHIPSRVNVSALEGEFQYIPNTHIPLPSKPQAAVRSSLHREEELIPDEVSAHSGKPVEIDSTTREALRKERAASRRAKLERQAANWKGNVIPSLLPIYMDLLRITNSLQTLDYVRALRKAALCNGDCDAINTSMVKVTCFERKAYYSLSLCTCTPISEQLMSLGYFPCAPYRPTLAVCIEELDFTMELFMNTTPNVTAWCETTIHFIRKRGIQCDSLESIRRRFTACQRWYRFMLDQQRAALREHLLEFRELEDAAGNEDNLPSEGADHASNTEPASRPSAVLRDRCPVCFGGNGLDTNEFESWDLVDAIVQLDANFTHKRRRTRDDAKDPCLIHPETVFIETSALDDEEKLVNSLRKSASKQATASTNEDAEDDKIEPGMRVPKSSLDECGKSFNAANEKRQATQTSHFADRGIMALLCRHERVLWLANVTTPGERQFIALALLRRLFAHLPPQFRVGLCYDIACQIDRSCNKWGLLQEFLPRLKFAVSIFHAYAHQWACQLVYHPRKCTDFGLTDGEGVERFWAMLKLFIPIMRVSGYYYRLYTLDSKVWHKMYHQFPSLGERLRKLWLKSAEMLLHANSKLQKLHAEFNLTSEELLLQFRAQVTAQTQPLTRQSKGLADKKIKLVITLSEERRDYQQERDELQNKLSHAGVDEQAEIHIQLQDIRSVISKLKDRIKNHRSALGVDGRQRLEKFLGDAYLSLRMNTLAVKQRLRSRLCARRLELSQIEKSLRKASSNHNKLVTHVNQEIKRKEPGIQLLAKKYNEMCERLSAMIDRGDAPRKALKPIPVPIRGLFRLDVDDAIWQDVGLLTDDAHEQSQETPGWLSSDNVREGITHVLNRLCCEKEMIRLRREKRAMMQWAREEWGTLERAIANEANPSVIYLLQCEQRRLREVFNEWERCTRVIPHADGEGWVDVGQDVSMDADKDGGESVADSLESDPEDNLSARAEEAGCIDILEELYVNGSEN